MGGELGRRKGDVAGEDVVDALDDEGGGDGRDEGRAGRKGIEGAMGRVVDSREVIVEVVGNGESAFDGGVRLERR